MNVPVRACAAARVLGVTTAPTHSRVLALVTFISWLMTASIGAYMLVTWIRAGGIARQRESRRATPPALVFGHFGLAAGGLVIWTAYLVTGWRPLSWAAAGLLMPAVGLGVATVTLWTPFPGPTASPSPGQHAAGPAPAGSMFAERAEDTLSGKLTDELLARAMSDDALAGRLADMVLANVRSTHPPPSRKPRGHLAALIPVGHGMGAVTTILLVMLTVVTSG